MWKIIILALGQSTLLAACQVFLKLALTKMLPFGWNKAFWISALTCWQLGASGLLCGASVILWLYIIKHFPLSVAYPMISLCYVLGILGGVLFLHESMTPHKWIGAALIVAGCCIIAR